MLTALQAARWTSRRWNRRRMQLQATGLRDPVRRHPGWEALILHSEDPILQDKRVRQAIVMALDAPPSPTPDLRARPSRRRRCRLQPLPFQAQTDALPFDWSGPRRCWRGRLQRQRIV